MSKQGNRPHVNLWAQKCMAPAEDEHVWVHQAIEMSDSHTVLLVGVNRKSESTCVRVEKVYQKWMFVAKETAILTQAQQDEFIQHVTTFMVRLGIIDWRKPSKIVRRRYLYPMMRHAKLGGVVSEATEEEVTGNHHELRSLYVAEIEKKADENVPSSSTADSSATSKSSASVTPATDASITDTPDSDNKRPPPDEYRLVNMAEVTICCTTPYTYGSKALRELLSHVHRTPSSILPLTVTGLPPLGASIADLLPCFDSLLEQLLVTKKFQEGAWIRVRGAQRPHVPIRASATHGSGAVTSSLLTTCRHEYRVQLEDVKHVSPEECQQIGLATYPLLSTLTLRTWIKHTYREVDPALLLHGSDEPNADFRKSSRACGSAQADLSSVDSVIGRTQAPVLTYDSDKQVAFLSYSFRVGGAIESSPDDTVFLTWLTRKSDQSESDHAEQVQGLIRQGQKIITRQRNPEEGSEQTPVPVPVRVFDSERQMLTYFARAVQRLDPDVFVGLRLSSVLRHVNDRIGMLNAADDSFIGRMRLSFGAYGNRGSSNPVHAIRGRLFCDLSDHIGDHVRTDDPDITLTTLARLHQINVHEYVPPSMQCLVQCADNAPALEEVIESTLREQEILHSVMEHFPVLKLSSMIASICGCLLSQTLQSGQVICTTYMLLHLYHQHDYVMPTLAATQNANRLFEMARVLRRQGGASTANSKAPVDESSSTTMTTSIGPVNGKYRGGLNLEPKVGFYRDGFHAAVDIINDYPSQIQQHNLCLSNQMQWCDVLNRRVDSTTDEMTAARIRTAMNVSPLAETLSPEERQADINKTIEDMAPLPRKMHAIQTLRRQRKSEAKEARQGNDLVRMEECETEQVALKLVLNGTYGNFGHDGFRFEHPLFAEVVTLLGRVSLSRVLEVCIRRGFEASQGDTDALMFDTRERTLESAVECANALVREYNQPYPFIQLELGNMYRAIVIIKCKNYMALEMQLSAVPVRVTFEMKSMLWSKSLSCDFARWVCEFICRHWMLRSVMHSKYTPAAEYGSDLQCLRDALTFGQSLIEAQRWDQFVLHQTLNQDLSKYINDTNDHVKVAKWMLSQGMDVQEGAVIPYIVCIDMTRRSSTSSHARDGVYPYHPMQVEAANGHLQPSLFWYIQNKICTELRDIYKIMSLKKPVLREQVAEAVKLQVNYKLMNQEMNGLLTRAYHAQQHLRHPISSQ